MDEGLKCLMLLEAIFQEVPFLPPHHENAATQLQFPCLPQEESGAVDLVLCPSSYQQESHSFAYSQRPWVSVCLMACLWNLSKHQDAQTYGCQTQASYGHLDCSCLRTRSH